MGLTKCLRNLTVRILACCDEATPSPKLVIGTPFGFQHVGGHSLLTSHHDNENEKSTHSDTRIEAFLENRRLALTTTTVQSTLRHQANKLSASIRASVYSNGEVGRKGTRESEEVLVVRGEEGERSSSKTSDGSVGVAESFEGEFVERGLACKDEVGVEVGEESEDEDVDGEEMGVEDGEIVVAQVVSIRRYGSTDLLSDSSLHEDK